jgi:hypothetical protein
VYTLIHLGPSAAAPGVSSRGPAAVVISSLKASAKCRFTCYKPYICPDGKAGQSVTAKRIVSDGGNATGDGNTGQPVAVKRITSDGGNAIGNGNAGQAVPKRTSSDGK